MYGNWNSLGNQGAHHGIEQIGIELGRGGVCSGNEGEVRQVTGQAEICVRRFEIDLETEGCRRGGSELEGAIQEFAIWQTEAVHQHEIIHEKRMGRAADGDRVESSDERAEGHVRRKYTDDLGGAEASAPRITLGS